MANDLDNQKKIIHVLLKSKKAIQQTREIELGEPTFRPLLAAIRAEFDESGSLLTRARFKQRLAGDKDILLHLRTYDSCRVGAMASTDDIPALVALADEGRAGRLANESFKRFKDVAKSKGYVAAVERLKADLAGVTGGSGALDIVTVANVQTQPISWLWDRRLAYGKISLITGDPDVGKSWLSLYIASRVTTGQPLPDDPTTNRIPCDVLVVTSEDDVADTIRPRLEALSADLKRVHVIRSVDLSRDIDKLRRTVKATKARLLILDPLNAFLGNKDSYKDAEVRAVLDPVAAMAAECGVAVLGLQHLTKNTKTNAKYRALGSVAFVGIARNVWSVTRDPEDFDRLRLVSIKSNLARAAAALAYRIGGLEDGGVTFDDGTLDLTADEAMSDAPAPQTQTAAAAAFLENLLANGAELCSDDIRAQALAKGISSKTLWRAKDSLHIAARQKEKNKWYWRLNGQMSDGNLTI